MRHWVSARIPSLHFKLAPGQPRSRREREKALLYIRFAAVPTDGAICTYPFLYSDHYVKSALMFGDTGSAGGPSS